MSDNNVTARRVCNWYGSLQEAACERVLDAFENEQVPRILDQYECISERSIDWSLPFPFVRVVTCSGLLKAGTTQKDIEELHQDPHESEWPASMNTEVSGVNVEALKPGAVESTQADEAGQDAFFGKAINWLAIAARQIDIHNAENEELAKLHRIERLINGTERALLELGYRLRAGDAEREIDPGEMRSRVRCSMKIQQMQARPGNWRICMEDGPVDVSWSMPLADDAVRLRGIWIAADSGRVDRRNAFAQYVKLLPKLSIQHALDEARELRAIFTSERAYPEDVRRNAASQYVRILRWL